MGKVIHSDMQGGSGEGIALTAYVLVTFLESQVSKSCSYEFNLFIEETHGFYKLVLVLSKFTLVFFSG